MINDPTFWPLWQSDQTVYMVTSKNILETIQKRYPQDHFYLKFASKDDVLVINHEDK